MGGLSSEGIIQETACYHRRNGEIEVYKAKAKGKISKPEEKKRKVYLLDKDNKITLPYLVRPVENNSSVVYYKLCDFLGKPNSSNKNKNKNEDDNTVYVQKKITINEKNQLKIKKSGNTVYELYEYKNNSPVKKITMPYKLNTQKKYELKLQNSHNNVHLQSVILEHNHTEKKWKFTYIF